MSLDRFWLEVLLVTRSFSISGVDERVGLHAGIFNVIAGGFEVGEDDGTCTAQVLLGLGVEGRRTVDEGRVGEGKRVVIFVEGLLLDRFGGFVARPGDDFLKGTSQRQVERCGTAGRQKRGSE